MRKLPVISAVVFFVLSAVRVDAESFVLVDLIAADGSVVQGDKLFDNFGVHVASEFGFAFPLIGNIVVEGITRDGERGLRFRGTWLAQGQPEGSSGFGIVLTYRVTSLNPEFLIHDLTIASSITIRDGLVALTEQAVAPDGLVLATAAADAIGRFPSDPGVTEISDHQVLSGDVPSMQVLASLSLVGFRAQCTPCGSASVDYVDHTFSQVSQTETIPEPGTCILVGAGLAAECARRRRGRLA